MYGNRLGWIIAIVLAGLIGLGVWRLSLVNRLTPPTTLLADAAALSPLTMEVQPVSVYRSDAPGDGGGLCRQAIAVVRRDADHYANLAAGTDAAAIDQGEAVRLLLTAAPLAGDGVLADIPANVNYGPPSEDAEAVALLGRLLARAAALHGELHGAPDATPSTAPSTTSNAEDTAAGERSFQALFSLGARLFGERIRYAEAITGLTMMRDAAAGLRSIALARGDATRAARIDAFDRSVVSLQSRRMQPVWDAVGTLDGDAIARHAGDVYAMTSPSNKERLWRVEAILALGRQRFNAGRLSDQLAASTRLRVLAVTETDPVVLAAVAAAEGLTIEAFRTIQ